MSDPEEEVLEPELEIIDPHHHLWDYTMVPADKAQDFYKHAPQYLLQEYLEDINTGHKITKTVFVQCFAMYSADESDPELRKVGETEFVNGIAAMSASGNYGPCRVAAAIIGECDLRSDSAEEALKAHLSTSSRFRGIRQMNFDPTGSIYGQPKFRENFALMEKYGLVFETYQQTDHVYTVTDLARAFPNVTIVLNHLGGPIGPSRFDPNFDYKGPSGPPGPEREESWRDQIKALAECPNVVVKLGGITMPLNGFELHKRETPVGSEELAQLLNPYMGFIIDCFTPARCMFETNFPVDKPSVSYKVLWNTYKRLAHLKGLTPEQKADIFSETARRVYKL
mmetsp:Transcript_25284/g.39666  ORF Transcript_25284/g.39666 Transcript_25284/m.39666 type:complete len:339 (+) Transcript_25284:164-1180(+)|eukprot:CAMPEP_0184301772 /NCGR_PEP_ID=MMETSP1049-20130417/11895_1 /TAXON_ID=77928 /ORGANISM="Proteomonas sulcata, Strain CCMP704" /LENGTH=338 /DNA_ID=CAMNT_0026612863 /DNA_START=123 /DNA_END=1139 /DNA_ORIENTATION=+